MRKFINEHPFVILASVLVIAETTFRIVKVCKKQEVKKVTAKKKAPTKKTTSAPKKTTEKKEG